MFINILRGSSSERIDHLPKGLLVEKALSAARAVGMDYVGLPAVVVLQRSLCEESCLAFITGEFGRVS